MKALITIAILVGAWFLLNGIYSEYKAKEAADKKKQEQAEVIATSDGLTGMNPQWEPSLQQAQAQGAATLKAWLERYGPHVQDPKLAAIQLDYVGLLSRQNPAEAKRIFRLVKSRVPPNSPVYPRVKKLEATYGP
jgi:hypothetical protein